MVIVSACLAGVACLPDGEPLKDIPDWLISLVKSGQAVLVCPEQQGSLPTPRPRAEIQGGTGPDVLEGRARVVDENGEDVTHHYIKGAHRCLQMALASGTTSAILKSGSCSCGCSRIPDGSFTGRQRDGEGVTAALFRKAGIRCLDESMFRDEDDA